MERTVEAGMVHLRLVVPEGDARPVLRVLERSPAVVNLVRLPECSLEPKGDLILCDVAREEASVIVDQLRQLRLDRAGSISMDAVDSTISTAASRAVLAARGSPADAVVWEEVEARTSESAELSFSFLAFMVLATLIAAVGILTDSQILIIGAMVVGPEFGPLAGLCIALVERRFDLARRSATALALGFPLAISVTLVGVLLLRAAGPAPDEIAAQGRPATFFISHPNTFSVLTALLAGVAGLLSLTTAKSGALLGVLISVTTIRPPPTSAWRQRTQTGRKPEAPSRSSASIWPASSLRASPRSRRSGWLSPDEFAVPEPQAKRRSPAVSWHDRWAARPLLAWRASDRTHQGGGERAACTHRQRG